MREVLTLFRFYRAETGVEGLLENVDLAGVLPRQVYHAVHGRAPESIHTALADRDYTIGEIFAAALRSGEFRRRLVSNVLAAYPEKRRLMFVHIPKCAGSNLSAHLIGRYASLNTNILDDVLTCESDFFLALKHLVLELEVSDTLFIHGHVHLQTYDDWQAIRLDDTVFTILRPPQDLVLSQVNYVLSRIFSDERPVACDTDGWRREFDVRDPLRIAGRPAIRDLAHRILHHRGVVPANVMAQFLGNGSADRAIEQIVTHNIEVTEIGHYRSWCSRRWNIDNDKRMNMSVQYVTYDDLCPDDCDLVAAITAEDLILHRRVAQQLEALGRPYLVGRDMLAADGRHLA